MTAHAERAGEPTEHTVDQLALMAALTEFSRAMLGAYDIGHVLYQLVDQVVDVLRVDGAGVSLAQGDGPARFVSGTDERTVRLEEAQHELGEGPFHDAHRTGRRVVCEDLRVEPTRWPRFAERARDAGCVGVAAIPMPALHHTIGALDIYRFDDDAGWPGDVLDTAQLLADMAAGYVIHARALDESRTLAMQLQHALDSRVVIERANGVIAERHGVHPAAAFTRLREYARSHSQRIHEVACDVIEGRLDL